MRSPVHLDDRVIADEVLSDLRDTPAECVTAVVVWMDGFLTGIAVSPVEIAVKTWQDFVVGVEGAPLARPEFTKVARNKLCRELDDIVWGLDQRPPLVEPRFERGNERQARSWADGLRSAMWLCPG